MDYRHTTQQNTRIRTAKLTVAEDFPILLRESKSSQTGNSCGFRINLSNARLQFLPQSRI
jgi:hypothetical protein